MCVAAKVNGEIVYMDDGTDDDPDPVQGRLQELAGHSDPAVRAKAQEVINRIQGGSNG